MAKSKKGTKQTVGQPQSSKSGDSSTASLILPPFLYLGPCSAASSSFVSSEGITHILSIGSTPATKFPNITYERIPLTDSPTSSLAEAASSAATFLDAVEAKGGKVLVHCSAAISRSPAVVAAYLVMRKKIPLKEAMGRIVRSRPSVSPNPGFLAQLNELEQECLGSMSLGLEMLPRKKEDRLALFKEG
ncbi:DSPc-domain-containing protein [Panus rudis PR-1116 ss-1]|nr:DSPc-domain-containing protein [Panus rudis PR-1116 ss-1]